MRLFGDGDFVWAAEGEAQPWTPGRASLCALLVPLCHSRPPFLALRPRLSSPLARSCGSHTGRFAALLHHAAARAQACSPREAGEARRAAREAEAAEAGAGAGAAAAAGAAPFLPPWSPCSDSEADEATAEAARARRRPAAAAGEPAPPGGDGGDDPAAPPAPAGREGLTPDWVIDAGCDIFGLTRPSRRHPVVAGLLDPCTNSKAKPNIPAAVLYDRRDDGLALANPWAGHFVVLNPAYESAVQWRFINRAIDEVEWGRVPGVLLICRNSTDTGYYQRLRPYPRCMLRRDAIRFKDYPAGARRGGLGGARRAGWQRPTR